MNNEQTTAPNERGGEKPKKKRILLASIIFDCGASLNHMYQPMVNWYFDFTNKEKPIHVVIKFAWQDTEKRYPFNDKIKDIMTSGKIIDLSISQFKDVGYNYKGKLHVDTENDFYLSPKGRDMPFVKDFETACKLYQ